MVNALISRFDGHNDRVPHEIFALEQSGLVRVKLHLAFTRQVSFPEAETLRWDFYYHPLVFDSPMPPADLLEKIEPELESFLLMQARVRIDRLQRSFELNAMQIHSDLNLFYRLAGFLHEKLEQHEVDLVLFDEIPHWGMDYVLYLVARAMGIRTILFLQNVHTERTLVMERIEDMGHLMDGPMLSPPLDRTIPNRFEQALYAPVDRGTNAVERQLAEMHTTQIRPKTVIGMLAVALVYLFELPLKWLSRGNAWIRGDRLNRLLYDMMGAELRKLQARRALEAEARIVVRDPDLELPFVLFALHFQPEATTYPLGGDFTDQLRAVEHLRRLLPNACRIYVKEHPESFGAMRDPHFYSRLAAIPGVELVAAEVDSHLLLARCQFVATITGTVGWEAITGGKPVLTFGYAWYNDLPGVFRIADSPTWDEITRCKIEHEDVTARFVELSRRFGNFTPAWGLEPQQLPAGFDRATNCGRFVETMKQLIG